jgi:hypothetical protein
VNNSVAELRATVVNTLVRLDQQPAGQGPGQHYQQGDGLREALWEQFSCPICFEIHHLVAVINDVAYQGGGCCKTVFHSPRHLLTRKQCTHSAV